jgi:hypothetical protein
MVQENDFMELNHKLTHLLKGRTILSESGDEGHVAITFDDQSTLKLKVAGQATVSVGAKVEAVHEAGEQFHVDLADGASVGRSPVSVARHFPEQSDFVIAFLIMPMFTAGKDRPLT